MCRMVTTYKAALTLRSSAGSSSGCAEGSTPGSAIWQDCCRYSSEVFSLVTKEKTQAVIRSRCPQAASASAWTCDCLLGELPRSVLFEVNPQSWEWRGLKVFGRTDLAIYARDALRLQNIFAATQCLWTTELSFLFQSGAQLQYRHPVEGSLPAILMGGIDGGKRGIDDEGVRGVEAIFHRALAGLTHHVLTPNLQMQ